LIYWLCGKPATIIFVKWHAVTNEQVMSLDGNRLTPFKSKVLGDDQPGMVDLTQKKLEIKEGEIHHKAVDENESE
jgi:hypothetical protein